MVAIQWRTRWSRNEKAAATTQTVASARTSERRYGPGRESTPRRPTGTEHGQGRGRGERDALHGHVPVDPTPQAPGTQYFSLDVVDEVLAAQPPPLVEVRPQLGVQRHTAEQVIETFVPVQVLDAPVPQLGEAQVVEFMQKFDAPVIAEPVIKVPKISLEKARRRLGDYLRPAQTAEQLVEVPTIASFSSLLRTAEHFVDIPVPHVRGGWGGEESLQGFFSRTGLYSVLWSRS